MVEQLMGVCLRRGCKEPGSICHGKSGWFCVKHSECGKHGCNEPGEVSYHKSGWYCIKHFRYSNACTSARRAKLYDPTDEELDEAMPKDMKCPHCPVTMTWMQEKGQSTQWTIQHWKSEKWEIMCLGCNCAEVGVGEEKFLRRPRKITPGYKWCWACEQEILFVDMVSGHHTCKACMVIEGVKRQANMTPMEKTAKNKQSVEKRANLTPTERKVLNAKAVKKRASYPPAERKARRAIAAAATKKSKAKRAATAAKVSDFALNAPHALTEYGKALEAAKTT